MSISRNINDEKSALNESLFAAINANNPEEVERLIKLGANVNALNSEKESALIAALKLPYPLSVRSLVNELLNLGADPFARTAYGKTCLALAVERDDKELVTIFLDKGFDINEKFGLGNETALKLSILPTAHLIKDQTKQLEMTRFILEKGAKPYPELLSTLGILYSGRSRWGHLLPFINLLLDYSPNLDVTKLSVHALSFFARVQKNNQQGKVEQLKPRSPQS